MQSPTGGDQGKEHYGHQNQRHKELIRPHSPVGALNLAAELLRRPLFLAEGAFPLPLVAVQGHPVGGCGHTGSSAGLGQPLFSVIDPPQGPQQGQGRRGRQRQPPLPTDQAVPKPVQQGKRHGTGHNCMGPHPLPADGGQPHPQCVQPQQTGHPQAPQQDPSHQPGLVRQPGGQR